eukprot:Rhum_TRINITY_DN14020_c1_g1::Rhum_TRINITY_DN14020_c1_g1_i1::g.67573::m.67573
MPAWYFEEEDLMTYYKVEYALTGRSKCKEFRCREQIAKGALRIGVQTDVDDDHRGNQFGWYHPNCLKKTFYYKSNENERVPISDVVFGDNISPADKKIVSAVFGEKTDSSADAPVAKAEEKAKPAAAAKKATKRAAPSDDVPSAKKAKVEEKDPSSMSKSELVEACRAQGLAVSGTKAALVQRLEVGLVGMPPHRATDVCGRPLADDE